MKKQIEEKKIKKKRNRTRDCEPKHAKSEWVLCSEYWRDIVIMYVAELNDIPIEDKNAKITQEGIKDAYLKYGKQRSHTRR